MESIKQDDMSKKKDQEWLAYVAKVREEVRNSTIDECIKELKVIISPVGFITVKDRLIKIKNKQW